MTLNFAHTSLELKYCMESEPNFLGNFSWPTAQFLFVSIFGLMKNATCLKLTGNQGIQLEKSSFFSYGLTCFNAVSGVLQRVATQFSLQKSISSGHLITTEKRGRKNEHTVMIK